MGASLSYLEMVRLENREEIIEAGLQAYAKAGKALGEIRDERLYRAKYATFEAYCRERWCIAESTAYQLIGAAKVVNNLVDNSSAIAEESYPSSEAVARPLVPLPAAAQREAWSNACAAAAPNPPTARHTAAAARMATIERRREETTEALEAQAETVEFQANPPPDWEVKTGDCLYALAALEPGVARLVFADPPYNQGVDYGGGADADLMPRDKYLAWCAKWFAEVRKVLTPDGSFWLLCPNEWADEFGVELRRQGFTRRNWVVWYESFGVNCPTKFNRTSRHLLHCVKDPDPKRSVWHPEAVNRPSDRQAKYNDARANPAGKTWDDLWGVNPPIPRLTGTCAERIPGFPTQLPLALLRPVVGCASDPGDLVIDPFSGSGTTGHAAVELGRRYLGVELSPKWAKLSRGRLAKVEREEVTLG